MNTENRNPESATVEPRAWSRADTLRVTQVLAAALLVGFMLRVVANNAPVTSVAAKPSPNSTGATTDAFVNTGERR